MLPGRPGLGQGEEAAAYQPDYGTPTGEDLAYRDRS